MSPIIKKKKERYSLPTRIWLYILTLLCVILMILSFTTDFLSGPLNYIGGYTIIPFQKGLSNVSTYLLNMTDNFRTLEELTEENSRLKEEVDQLTIDNALLQQDKYELTKLRELFELSAEYEDYDTIGARVISRDAGNWYSAFVIDKGSNDGIIPDCNVIAGSGLVGRVTEVGPNYAKVVSIISDNINTSGMILSTSDTLIVSGSLELIESNMISFSQLVDRESKVGPGDKIVTSNISDKYLQGILIGYVNTIVTDSNNLTKSGTLIPAADFRHLEEVLVITKTKQQVN